MHSLLKLLYLLWCPWLVLGAYQVQVQSSPSPLAPGDTITYDLTADPLPTTPLGLVLIPVAGSDPNAPRVFTQWTVTLTASPQQFNAQIPDGLAHSFYTIDMHQNSSVYSPLLASSNSFEIVPPSTSSSTSASATQTSQSSSTTTQSTNTPQSQSTSPPGASTTGIPHKSNSSVIGAAVGGTIGGITLILLALLLFCRLRRRNVRQTVLIDDHVVSPYDPPMEQTSPFAESYRDRQFIPSQPSLTRVSPFVVDVERQTQTPSDPSIAKNRELVMTHVQNASSTDSSGYMDSLSTGLPQAQLRSERERLLGEISALRSGAGQSTFSASSVAGTDISGRADSDSSDMRNRLEQLTEHVRRLETALEHATQVYDAPPTYNVSER